jgi:hypothetical protein
MHVTDTVSTGQGEEIVILITDKKVSSASRDSLDCFAGDSPGGSNTRNYAGRGVVHLGIVRLV